MNKELFIYLQILGSFDYLKLPTDSDDIDPISPLTIILYKGLEEDYADFVVAFAKQVGARSKPKGSKWPKEDKPKEVKYEEVKKKLQSYCEHLLHAKQHEYGNSNIHHPIDASIDDIYDLEDVEFVGVKVTIGDFSEIVAMFPCFEEEDGTQFFITYGFTEDYAFVFTQRSRKAKAQLFGLAEPTPVIDESFRNRRHLEKLFAQLHRTYNAKPAKSHPICSLNKNQKFRLCSLVDNARSSLAHKVPSQFGAREDIDRTQKSTCEEKLVVTFQEASMKHLYEHVRSVQVTALPCFITQYRRAVADFLIVEDPSDKHSVFLLERIQFRNRDTFTVIVVGRIRDIALLKHANDFF